jgi:radical SAM protein (TIGR01212 family)
MREHCGAERFIAYFQAWSGTYAPVERLRALYEKALKQPGVVGISVGTRPDCVTPDVADLLEELGRRAFVTLELGLQSAFDETLRRVNRAHTFADFTAAMDLCAGRGFDLCVHVILGLPGETREHYRATAQALAAWDYQSVKVHPLHVVKGTVLAAEHARGEYRPLGFEDYLEALADFLERVPATVGVQRFTAAAPPGLLIAPLWCRDKNAVLNGMKRTFARRGTRQGSYADAGSPTGEGPQSSAVSSETPKYWPSA